MPDMAGDDQVVFAQARPRLQRVAYRMLGSVAEAEDVVQDAWLRWQQTDRAEVREPEHFLVRTVTRLCLDVLKSAHARRETYVGPWLPEPVFDPVEDRADELTAGLMLALERLSPLERAAFLLHDVFDLSFEEVARTLSRDAAACRQLASRARQHVRAARPRYPVDPAQGQALANAFFAASRAGDLPGLQRLLADEAVTYTDGGGRATSAFRPIHGADKVARFFVGVKAKFAGGESVLLHTGTVDGMPGFITLEAGDVLQTTVLAVEDGRIAAIYIVRNPDKLGHLAQWRDSGIRSTG